MILLTGPCVIENRDNVMKIAEQLTKLNENKRIDFYFKASFDKANRTSLDSFRGPGLDEGLKILQQVHHIQIHFLFHKAIHHFFYLFGN